MDLPTLLDGFAALPNQGLDSLRIKGLALDSRLVKACDAFIALNGSRQHGLAHAGQAIANGAEAILFDPDGYSSDLAETFQGLPAIAISGLGEKLGNLASRFYGQPSEQMTVVGITGTNGKTSCSQFLAQTLNACGIIGTLGWGEWGHLIPTANTTPDALAVQRMLASLHSQGKKSVAMEVSSHGLEQGRVNGVKFTGAVFTNITRDHLDYHGTMEAYLQAKLRLLAQSPLAFVVVNLDSEYSGRIIANIPATAVVWGVSRLGQSVAMGETLHIRDSQPHAEGIRFSVTWRNLSHIVKLKLFGEFNIENVALVLATLLALGHDLDTAVAKLQNLKPVAGRMEVFGGGKRPLVFVDYAHTPDALDNVLRSARKHCQGDLWTVFGCGGNRDSGKRALMGNSSAQWADRVIVTDDNPRYESSADIIKTILQGCDSCKTETIANREQAINYAINQAAPHDCIVVAGKGHEDYQEINGVKHPFSDRQVVLEALSRRA